MNKWEMSNYLNLFLILKCIWVSNKQKIVHFYPMCKYQRFLLNKLAITNWFMHFAQKNLPNPKTCPGLPVTYYSLLSVSYFMWKMVRLISCKIKTPVWLRCGRDISLIQNMRPPSSKNVKHNGEPWLVIEPHFLWKTLYTMHPD